MLLKYRQSEFEYNKINTIYLSSGFSIYQMKSAWLGFFVAVS